MIPAGALAFLALAVAQGPDSAGPPGARELARPDLEAWLDGFMPFALRRGDVAGAVVVVVKDGGVLLQKGYGLADRVKTLPVDPERTLFRPGSVSKLITWTAVMQLVEQGKLDLDRDVNAYLDFTIPPRDGQPVTLRHLMTHTPGFEETLKSLIGDDPEAMPTLEAYLKRWVPNRIFAPGTVPAYSNYGVALAGHVVARVSGESFDDYLDRHIFAPLGMQRSTFRQPLPDALREDMSRGYQLGSGTDQKYELVGPAPAGSMAATGADMARFMLAHLGGGALDSARILQPETVRLMHGTAAPVIPPLNGMLLGFYQRNVNGRRIIGHDGDTQYFHSMLSLFPDDGIGIFLSVNSSGIQGAAGTIRTALLDGFIGRYLPNPAPGGVVDSATAAEHARVIAGRYQPSRRAESSFLSLLGLFGQAKVMATDSGSISVPALTGMNGQPKKWVEVEPFVWREVGGTERLAAKLENDRVTMWSVDEISPFIVFQPVVWWKSGGWLVPAVILSLVMLGLTLVAWPAGAIARRRYRAPFPLAGAEARALRFMRLAALAVFATLVAWLITIQAISSSLAAFSPARDPLFRFLRVLTFLVFVAALLAAVWNSRRAWTGKRGWFARGWSTLLVGATLTLLWVGVVFNLAGVGADY
jgi:CubicO group peptidase (beta-lactamase class C family)